MSENQDKFEENVQKENETQDLVYLPLFHDLRLHDEKKCNHRLSALQLAIGEEEREVKQKLEKIQAKIQNKNNENP